MKFSTLVVALLLVTALRAQETVTVTTGPSNSLQTFYSLQNGILESRELAEWDLAFEITGFTASILVNTAKGMQAYKAPYGINEWASVDTNGMAATWTRIHNSDLSWSQGALNQGLTSNEFDLGWGVYNVITHTVAGDSIFVVKFADQQWKKLRIDGLAANVYSFTWSDLDGGNEQTGSLAKGPYMAKNFGYYSLENGTALDREPATAEWDLLFTKYEAFVPTAYPVAGVLLNKNVTALRIDGVPPSQTSWMDGEYSSDINAIGFDWKSFNMQTFQYEYNEELTFYVADQQGNIWKLVFIEYGGSANGDMTFTQEMVSATSVEDLAAAAPRFTVFPNPTDDGNVQMLVDAEVRTAMVTVIDLGGRVVAQHQYAGLNGGSLRSLDVSALTSGMYLVRLDADGASASTRLVIE